MNHLASGGRVANMSVATDESYINRQTGDKVDKTEWHRVVTFQDGLIDMFEKHAVKGRLPELRDQGTRRFSFCCADCRLRATPPSVRFFGRRFYLGALFVLVSALVLRGGVRLQTIKRKWGISVATLRRWRRWWLAAFPVTEPWGAKRGELVMPPEEVPLLFLLRQMQGGRFGERLLLSLIWFRPWTGYCGLGDGPVPPAESDSVTPG